MREVEGLAYQFVAAYNCHDAERLHAVLFRVEFAPAGLLAIVAKDNVGMDFCIEIFLA